MKIEFLGTRGYIEPRTKAHRMHSSVMVSYKGKRVMVDCGEDWLGRIPRPRPGAIVLTHGHPDHAWGLRDGAPCPVYATSATWEKVENCNPEDKRTLEPGRPLDIEGITFEAFAVEHSTRAPAVGYRITAGRVAVFYAPDLVYIPDRTKALKGIRYYIGDGATVTRSMVRKSSEKLIGHTPVRTQLTWCAKEGVTRALITHCGAGIVEGGKEAVEQIRALAEERGVEVEVATDGMELVLR